MTTNKWDKAKSVNAAPADVVVDVVSDETPAQPAKSSEPKPAAPVATEVIETRDEAPAYTRPNFIGEHNLSAAQGIAGEAEPNGTAATATPLGGTNVVVTGNIFPNADVDFWSFTANAGDRVYAVTANNFSAGTSIDSQMNVISSDGTTVLEFDDDDGFVGFDSSMAGTTIPAAGTYFIRLNHFSATTQLRPYFLHFRLQSGGQTAEVEPNDTPATATPVPANGWLSGARGTTTDVDYFSVSANAGDTIYVGLDLDPERDVLPAAAAPGGWNGRLGIALFGDTGNQILVANDPGNALSGSGIAFSESLYITVKTTGTYYGYVDAATAIGSAAHTYHLSVSVLPATPVGTNCTVYTSADAPQAIGPAAGTVTNSTITVPGNPRIEDLNVSIVLNHAIMQDIDAALLTPAGNENSLFTDVGASITGGQNQMDIDLDDEAGIPPIFTVLKPIGYQPEAIYRLGWLKGENAGGVWTLRLRDDANATAGGTLTSWSITVCEPPAAPVCSGTLVTKYASDFEADAGGFTHSGTADEWERGLPAFVPIQTCNSGTNCWKTDLDNTYNATSNQDLLSPTISLSGLTSPIRVSWAQRYQMAGGTATALADTFTAEVRNPGPANATNLFRYLDATMTDSVGSPAATINESAGWGLVTRSLDAYAGQNVELRFNLTSDGATNLAGLAIDDVTVTACCTPASCDDGNVCTDDSCDSVLGCVHTPNANSCSDGNACTGPDVCAGGVCTPGPNPCDDDDECTIDVCDGEGGCTYDPVDCNDSNVCTDDSCNPATGCINAPNTNPCTDGNVCTIGDVCAGGTCVPGPLPASVQYCNTTAITVPLTPSAGSPYPASISVSGAPTVICRVTVDLLNITHTFPDDFDVLLARAAGANALIMSDVGGGTDVTGVNLTLADAAGSPLPDATVLTSGTFQPTNVGTGDVFPAPAPAPTGGSALSVYNGQDPNGTWDLWVSDQFNGDGGSIGGGWCINVSAACSVDAECDDGNGCTDDTCVAGGCVYTNNTAACSDGDPCTSPDVCGGGVCVPGINPCDDDDECTIDVCDGEGGCTYDAVDCNDSNVCTDDSCNPATGCEYANNTNACSDGNPCTIGDLCGGGTCVPGAGPLPAPVQFCDNNPITINDTATPPTTATPYPASIAVSGLPGWVCSTTVDLNGITQTFPDDIDILLAHSTANAIIMSDVGGSTPVVGVSISLSDAAATNIPDAGPLVAGTFKPTNVNPGTGTEAWPVPAPAPLGGSALSIFAGTDPNGNWDLHVVDDQSGDSGSLDGWCVNVVAICLTNAECDDANPCTDDSCAAGFCVNAPNVAPCDDANVCTDDVCAAGACVGTPNVAACDDANPCTAGDVCGGGVCTPGAPVPPPGLVTGVAVAADKSTISWSSTPAATQYDVLRGDTDFLPVGPGGGDETCFPDAVGTSFVDGGTPGAGSAYYYLVRAESLCGTGSYGNQSNATPRVSTTCP